MLRTGSTNGFHPIVILEILIHQNKTYRIAFRLFTLLRVTNYEVVARTTQEHEAIPTIQFDYPAPHIKNAKQAKTNIPSIKGDINMRLPVNRWFRAGLPAYA